MDRDCDRCVYSTRSGGCRSWSCNFQTVDDIKAKAKKDVLRDIDEYKNLTNSDKLLIVNDEWVKSITEQIRADERAKTLYEFVNYLCQYNLGSIALTKEQNESIWRDIREKAEQMQKGAEE